MKEEKRPYLTIVTGEELWALVEQNLPVGLFSVLFDAKQRITAIESDYELAVRLGKVDNPFASIEHNGIRVDFGERYPNQLLDKPFEIRMDMSFPSSGEGLAQQDILDRLNRTGEPVEVSGEYLKLGLPDIVRRLSREMLGVDAPTTSSVQLSPVEPGRSIPVRVVIESDSGDQFVLPYIDWKIMRSGEEEIMLSNQGQPIPLLMTQSINHPLASGNIHAELLDTEDGVPAPWVLRWLQLQMCITQPCRVRVTSVERELDISVARREGKRDPNINPEWYATVQALASAQRALR